jgi:PAS domain S-box-containing protein
MTLGSENPGVTTRTALRVLFFEDRPMDVELSLCTLQSAGFDVSTDVVVTLEAALRQASTSEYDVILADYRVPGATGMDVFKALKAQGVSVPFILVTGSLGDETAVECLKEGVADYVLKDRQARLPVAVRRALDERRLREERTHAERALRHSEASYRSLIESAPCGILRVSAGNGRFLDVNGAMAEMLGYDSAADLLAREPRDRPAVDVETRSRLVEEYEQNGLFRETDVEWKRKDGAPITVRLSGRLLQDKNGVATCFEMIAENVTAQKRMEAQLREQNLTLEETNHRVEAANRMKSEFLANMSHELRSPLNCIVGFSELLFDGRLGSVSDRQKEIVGRVLNSAKHLLQLINDVLDLSKVEAGRWEFHPESISTGKLIHEVTGILGGLAGAKGIQIETEVEPVVATVVADPSRLKQILYNYVSNAIKFTGECGRVRVNLRAEGPSEFRLEVSDTGVGIAPNDIRKLFAAFQQLDSGKAKRFQGTGLGLALTKRIVEAQGGRVGVDSTLGEGSTFFAVLPREGYSQPAAPSPQVLIVEDERIERTLLRSMLQKEGFGVETARTFAEAVAKCHDQSFDAITLDWLLPDGDGKQVLEEIRSIGQNRTTPVIVISMIEEMEAAALPGIQEVLRKPVSREDLVAAMERAGMPVKVKVLDGE